MADPNVDILTVDEVETYLASENAGTVLPDDDVLETMITAVSAAVQNLLSRNIVEQSYALTVHGRGASSLSVPNTPITAVSSLRVDGITIPAATGPVGLGYVFDDNFIHLRGGQRFTRGVKNVEVSYTAGWPVDAIPQDIKLAALEGLRGSIEDMRRQPNVSSQSAGDHSLSFFGPEVIAAHILGPRVTALLQKYQRVVGV